MQGTREVHRAKLDRLPCQGAAGGAEKGYAMAQFYVCKHCKNFLVTIVDGGVTPACCGEPMDKLEANTTDAATEKHVPVVSVERDGHIIRVTVGEVEHPMTDEHYIQFIALEADGRIEVRQLKPGQSPTTFFAGGVAHGTVYAYCNLHGLWKASF